MSDFKLSLNEIDDFAFYHDKLKVSYPKYIKYIRQNAGAKNTFVNLCNDMKLLEQKIQNDITNGKHEKYSNIINKIIDSKIIDDNEITSKIYYNKRNQIGGVSP